MSVSTCTYCGGSSYIDGEVCLYCMGSGRLPIDKRQLQIEKLIIDRLDDINLPTNVFDSYVVLEELDTTEYNALTDTQKDGVKVLLSCGLVNLNDGKAGKVRLWNWFGAESTTVANLTALLE